MKTGDVVTSRVDRIVEQLRQVQEGGAWHGPSVNEALAGVDARDAERRPVAGAHSIAEIVHHLSVVTDVVRAHVRGETAPDEPDWPAKAEPGDKTREEKWADVRARLEASQRALREAVARLAESTLHENVPGQSHSYAYELQGLAQHDAYHAGQIALLKKGR